MPTPRRLATAAGVLALAAAAASPVHADSFVDEAKAKVKAATSRSDKWDGPTSGPKGVAGKTVVYVAADLRNGGIQGVGMVQRDPVLHRQRRGHRPATEAG